MFKEGIDVLASFGGDFLEVQPELFRFRLAFLERYFSRISIKRRQG